MTKKELLDSPAFKRAKDDARIWIQMPNVIDEAIPKDTWLLPFTDGSQNLIIRTREPNDND